jgi:hypothetical protein
MSNPGIASRSAVATLRTGDYLLSPLKVLSAGASLDGPKKKTPAPEGARVFRRMGERGG